MKICIVVPTKLPVPAVQGGAIEGLIEILCRQNEVQGQNELLVISRYHKEAQLRSKCFLHTRFVYLNREKWYRNVSENFLIPALRAIYKKIHHCDKVQGILSLEYEQRKSLSVIRKKKPDRVVIEAGDLESYHVYTEFYPCEKMYLHIHSDFTTWSMLDKTFGTYLVISEFVKKHVEETSTHNEDQIKVLKNVVDENKFLHRIKREERCQIRESMGVEENDFLLLYCGRIMEEKGVRELIDAVNEIDSHIRIKLIVIGNVSFGINETSDYYEDVLAKIAKSNGKVHYLGYIANEELYKYYQCADVQVVPSLWEEAAGLVILEGMHSLLPAIVTWSGGIPEYTDENCALFIEREGIVDNLKYAIEYLYKHKDICIQMRKNQMKKRFSYSKKEYYNNFVSCLEE